jgi:hypothetical protein
MTSAAAAATVRKGREWRRGVIVSSVYTRGAGVGSPSQEARVERHDCGRCRHQHRADTLGKAESTLSLNCTCFQKWLHGAGQADDQSAVVVRALIMRPPPFRGGGRSLFRPGNPGSSMGTSRRMAEYLQAFYKRFSGPMGAFPAACRGADAWQITTCGHGVLQTSPHGRALMK